MWNQGRNQQWVYKDNIDLSATAVLVENIHRFKKAIHLFGFFFFLSPFIYQQFTSFQFLSLAFFPFFFLTISTATVIFT